MTRAVALDRVIETILVDCYNEDEAYTAFLTVIQDVAFPADTLAGWLHAAYRHHLGLKPFPATPRPNWTWPHD
jgi:hypothetical protein